MDDQLNSNQIQKYLMVQKRPRILTFDRISSTQDYALRHRLISPSIIVANQQTAGRGQRGHRFYSPETSGIYMTITLPANERFIKVPGLLAAGTGIAVASPLIPLTHRKIGIKWMNDIYSHGRKCGGILIETVSDDQNRIKSFVIGIGLNLWTHSFPSSISQRAGYLFSRQPSVSRNQLIAMIYTRLISIYVSEDRSWIVKKYQKMMIWRNRTVSFIIKGHRRVGTVRGIDSRARLVIESQGRLHHLNYKNASQIRLV